MNKSIEERFKRAQQLRSKAVECLMVANRMTQDRDRREMLELADQCFAMAESLEEARPSSVSVHDQPPHQGADQRYSEHGKNDPIKRAHAAGAAPGGMLDLSSIEPTPFTK